MDYRYGSHMVFRIEYHFVWVTKYRYKVLTGDVGERVRELVKHTCEAFEIRILKGGGEQRPRAHSGLCAARVSTERDHEADQRADSEQAVRRVSDAEEALLGKAFLGAGVASARRLAR
jgi:REP-associated tyrosine transposase